MQRDGREILFSIDVDTQFGRQYFHVAAQSAADAIDKFMCREEYTELNGVISLSVFDKGLEERAANQSPLKTVNISR